MKSCKECGIKKELELFVRNKSCKDGYANQCKSCVKVKRAIYLLENKEKIKISTKKYRDSHKEERRIKQKIYRELHKEDIRKYNKEYERSSAGKKTSKKSRAKYPNANKSRVYYRSIARNRDLPNVCENCKLIGKVEGHHDDYNKPMDVTYLCIRCHKDWHKENTPLNRVSGIFTEGKK